MKIRTAARITLGTLLALIFSGSGPGSAMATASEAAATLAATTATSPGQAASWVGEWGVGRAAAVPRRLRRPGSAAAGLPVAGQRGAAPQRTAATCCAAVSPVASCSAPAAQKPSMARRPPSSSPSSRQQAARPGTGGDGGEAKSRAADPLASGLAGAGAGVFSGGQDRGAGGGGRRGRGAGRGGPSSLAVQAALAPEQQVGEAISYGCDKNARNWKDGPPGWEDGQRPGDFPARLPPPALAALHENSSQMQVADALLQGMQFD